MKKRISLSNLSGFKIHRCFRMLFLMLMLTSIQCSNESGNLTDTTAEDQQTDGGEDQTDDSISEELFTRVTRITPSGINEGDFFGYAIAATSTITAVSVPFSDQMGQRTGGVYTFMRNGSDFEPTAETIYPSKSYG